MTTTQGGVNNDERDDLVLEYLSALEADVESQRTPVADRAELPASLAIARARLRPWERRTAAPSVGQIWRADVAGDQAGQISCLLALTYVDGTSIRGVLVDMHTEIAALDDMIVPAEQSPTREAIVLCLWRDMPLASTSLTELVGTLDDILMVPVLWHLQHCLTGRPYLFEQMAEDHHVVSWCVARPEEPEKRYGYATGDALRADDPRAELRRLLQQATGHLERAALAQLDPAE